MKWITLFVAFLAMSGVLFSPPASAQAQDQSLSDIWVVVTTATGIANAGTDDAFTIGLLNEKGEVFKGWRQVSRPWDDNEPGRTESYHYIMENGAFYNHSSYFSNSTVCIRAGGRNAWLISSIFVIGRLVSTGQLVLLAGNPLWRTDRWLSLQGSDLDSSPAYRLDGNSNFAPNRNKCT